MIELRQSSVINLRIKFQHGRPKKCAGPALKRIHPLQPLMILTTYSVKNRALVSASDLNVTTVNGRS
jgi:hypothetical protein